MFDKVHLLDLSKKRISVKYTLIKKNIYVSVKSKSNLQNITK